jgi:hypothetical protein
MAKIEEFRGAGDQGQETKTRDALVDAAFAKPTVTRVADTGWVPIVPGGSTQQQAQPRYDGQVGRVGGGTGWAPVDVSKWSKTNGSDSPTGANPVQWNGGRPDVSRGPGGTVWQPRPNLDQGKQGLPRQGEGPGIAPIVIGATRDQTGKWVGPTILPDVPQYQAPPSDKGRAGGLVERDGKLVDERSEKEKAHVELDLAGFIGGAFVGFLKGGMKGGIAGGIIGVVAAELLKPLNPFK